MRILICDDHRLVREGLRMMLEKAGFEIVAEATGGHEVLELARRLLPQIVLMDVSIPGLNGIEATRQLTAELPEIRVVGLSVNTDRRYADAMFEAGATGYLPKSSGLDELLLALQRVASGLEYRSPTIGTAPVDPVAGAVSNPNEGASRTKPLSPREREVLQLIARGKSNKEIAAALDIGAATVETHRRQLMDKLGLRTVAELTKYAVKAGLTSLD